MLRQLRWWITIPIIILLVGMVSVFWILHERFTLSTGVYLLVILIGSFISWLIAKQVSIRITKPINQLSSITRKSAQDQDNLWSEFESYTELDELALAIKSTHDQFQTRVQQLDTERSQLAAILFEMSDGVIIVDGRSNILLINPAVSSFFDVEQESIL